MPYRVTDANGKRRAVRLPEKRVVTYSPQLARKQTYEINRQVEKARALGVPHTPIEVLGTGSSAFEAGLASNERQATTTAIGEVYELTGVSPDEVDLFMCNDFFLSSEIVSAEACGYKIVIVPKDVARNLLDGSDRIVVEYDGK